MKRVCFAAVCLAIILTGCQQAETQPAAEVLEPEVMPAEEPMALKTYWTLELGDAVVSLRDSETAGELEVILDTAEGETVVRTLRQDTDYATPDNISGWLFQDILGSDGFALRITWGQNPWGTTTYYALEGDRAVQIADSFGLSVDDHAVDLDGDGVRELVSNNMYGGDGHLSVSVFQRREDGVWVGSPVWGDLPGHFDWGVNSTWEEYDPDENVFRIHYSIEGQEEPGTLESTSLDNIEFYPYKEAE